MYHQIKIKGLVQGVGFRPFIYNLAVWMELVGYVTNSAYGVLIVLRATQKQLNLFLHQIDTQKPKLSEIESLEIETIKSNEIFTQFQIKESQNSIELSSKIPTDLAMCQECQDEMEDKNNRRYRYPFISCVNCGPRFSIIKNLPYDRDKTSMDSFVMCKDCEVEYKNPKDRRYHAQPIGCFECGTQLTDENSIESVVASIKDGKIVAIKGVGGYHLVCDATNDVVVQLLRERKQRPSKPFGVMVQNLEVVKTLTYTNEKELELLSSHRRPIVLLKKKESDILSENIAKNIDQIGVFLAPTPLYHLILAKLDRAIVVTSANLSGEPLCKNREDIMKLSYVWDYLLDNNREIINSCDDSVVFVEDEQEFILRGARGYAPTYLKLPNPSPKKLLCLGANQKSTVAICVEERVILSPYIGDLDGVKTIEH
ncbi:MAG: carbamoyltransferase HypF, partial [Campylobacterota bacterium]|nr:carbamoyltransferase HypF [Campylobacterota bacterium]